MFLALGWLGLLLLAWRLIVQRQNAPRAALELDVDPLPLVSIIVPARNEARNLPTLLASLKALDYPRFEIIVVDDQSDDGTGAVAASFGACCVAGAPRPEGWMGKQWACHQGALVARGELLLFTDADTEHAKGSLARSVASLRRDEAELLSAVPYHAGAAWWEQLTGAFHLLLFAVTAPYATPRFGRLYAIGQYLLVRREAYDAVGGHAAVRAEFVEDLPLANAFVSRKLRFKLMTDTTRSDGPLFRVRMYETLGDFLRGWRRNVRAGMGGSSPRLILEMIAMIAALTGGGHFASSGASAALFAASALVVAWAQTRLGRFHVVGALLSPLAVALFCLVSFLALFDMLAKQPLIWKGRAYSAH